MLEVFTVGGGEYLVNTFNAVVAWTGAGGFKSLIRVVMVMGLIFSLLVTAMNLDWRAWFRWFVQATLIYSCLMVPTVNVKVTDRINPSLAPSTVNNVPLGLGVMASFTSQVGDYFTRQAETVFVMPSSLNYSTGGIVYGARLWEKVKEFEIKDPVFRANLDAHIKQCVFYDVLFGAKSLELLSESTDLWADLGANAATNRAQKYMIRDGTIVQVEAKTCADAWAAMNAEWTTAMNKYVPKFAQTLYPKSPLGTASAKLANDLPVVGNSFTGNGQSANSLLRQKSLIDAFGQAQIEFGDDGADAFSIQRADTQARNGFTSVAQQAMVWVPVLNIVLTIVFYAMFPVIFPLFLFPNTGISTLKGYLGGFFYLAAWGPLFVLLHMFIMDRVTSQTNAVAAGGLALANWSGIESVNVDTATLAGFLMMSVPLLAGMLARGAMSISTSAGGLLQPAQAGGEAAALERTTGNYSYGDVSFANLNTNNRQENQWTQAPSYLGGAGKFTVRGSDGVTGTEYGNGRVIMDSSGGMSQLPFKPMWNSGYTSEMRQQGQWYLNEADRMEAGLSNSVAQSSSSASGTVRSTSEVQGRRTEQGEQSGTSLDRRTGQTIDTSRGVSVADNLTNSGRQTRGRTDSEIDSSTWRWGANASLDGSYDKQVGVTPGKDGASGTGGGEDGGKPVETGLDLSTSAKLGGGYDSSSTMQGVTSTGSEVSRTGEHRVGYDLSARTGASLGTHTSNSSGTFERDSSYSDSSSSVVRSSSSEDRDVSSAETRNAISQYREIGSRMMNEANYAESHSFSMSNDMSNLVAERYNGIRSASPELHLPDLANPNLSLEQMQRRDSGVRLAMGDLMGDLRERRTNELTDVAPIVGAPALAVLTSALTPKKKGDNGLGDGDLSGPVDTTLSRSGLGFQTHGPRGRQVGTAGFVGALEDLGQSWAQTGRGRLSFGEMSREGGGRLEGHDGHARGREVDVRPIRTDGSSGPVTWQDPKYDRAATRDLVQMVRDQHPSAVVLFNDPVLIREGITQRWDGHDNHLHLRF